jgi:hypothetical protein
MSWLEALRNLDTETAQGVAIATDEASSATELLETLAQQGAKSDKRGDEGLLSLLAPPHIRNSESHALRHGCREKDISTQGRPWLDALKSLEARKSKVEKRKTDTASAYVEEISRTPIQRGAKSAKAHLPCRRMRRTVVRALKTPNLSRHSERL